MRVQARAGRCAWHDRRRFRGYGRAATQEYRPTCTCLSVRLEGTAAPEPALPNKPSIAVLPFTNMSGDSDQDYFADGIVEDITTALSRVRALFVIARNSSFTYKGRAADVIRVGRELGVR